MFALNRAAERILRLCGVWQELPSSRRFGYERMCVWDAGSVAPGAKALRFDCAEIGEPNLGSIVDGGTLQWESLRAVRAAGIQLIEAGHRRHLAARCGSRGEADRRPQSARSLVDRGRWTCLDGTAIIGHRHRRARLSARCLGGAGAQPPYRIRTPSWQRFLPGGPIAFLPLSDGRSSIVWSNGCAEAARLRALEPTALGAAVTAASGEVLGECMLTTAVSSYPLQLQYALDYQRPRAVLIGDAAHVVHPLAGQGLNLGLLDCASLVQVLGEAGGAVGFGDTRVLRRYERWRRSENLLAATALDALQRFFAAGGSAGLTGAALNAVGKLPMARRGLAKRAMGLEGDLPEFLRTAL